MSSSSSTSPPSAPPSPASPEPASPAAGPQPQPVAAPTVAVAAAPAARPASGSARSQFAAALQRNFARDEAEFAGMDCQAQRAKPRATRFRGVTKHKRTQRYEAHIWECKKQIYLGGFDSELLAARSHDLMALRCKGPAAAGELLNFPAATYADLAPLLERLSREDVTAALRNYSKAQTAARLGGCGGGAAGGGLHRPAPRAPRAPRRAAGGAPPAPRRLSISVARHPSPVLSGDEGCGEGCDDEDDDARASPAARYRYRPYSPRFAPPIPLSPRLHGLRCLAPPPPPPSSPRAPRLYSPAAAPFTPLGGARALSARHTAGPWGAAFAADVDEDFNLDGVLTQLMDDSSLTFSSSEEQYLFEAVPLDAAHTALEHLSGAALLQDATPSSPSSPGSPALRHDWRADAAWPALRCAPAAPITLAPSPLAVVGARGGV